MKKLVSALATLALVITLATPTQAADPVDPNAPTTPTTTSTVGDAYNESKTRAPEGGAIFLIAEEGNFQATSEMFAYRSNTENSDSWICKGALDSACAPSKVSFVSGSAMLPVCKTDASENCIVDLQLAAPGADFEPATYVRNTTGITFPAVPSVNYPGASTTSLWEAKNAPSTSGTTSYAVVARASVGRGNSGKFEISNISATVIPFREQKGDYLDPKQETVYEDDVKKTRNSVAAMGYLDNACAWNEKGTCGVTQDYVEGTRVKLTIRLTSSIGGWFKGRMKNTNISVSKFSSDTNLITVSAEPAVVPRLSYTVQDNTTLSAQLKSYVTQNGFGGGWKSGFTTWAPSWYAKTFNYVEALRAKVADTSSGVNSFWNFSSSENENGGNRCLSDKSRVLGIVTTNAMVYDGGVPKFTGGFLNYKVAGLHYAPGGEELNYGVYDMVMRSETARCLYNFSNAPLSATVSVVNDKGAKSTAVTTVSEKNGWLKLAAYGFTFSNKTIKVKITKKKK